MNKGVNGKKGHSKVCRKMLEWCYCFKMLKIGGNNEKTNTDNCIADPTNRMLTG